MKKRIFSFLLVLVFVLSMSGISAFAYDYYLDFGDIDIVTENHYGMDFQVVHIGDYSVPDFNPTITQYDPTTPTSNGIDVYVSGGATANVTLKDIYYESDTGGTFFDVNGEAGDTVVLTVKGYNTIISYDDDEDDAIIEVEDENLIIKGDGVLDIEADTNGAKIGSDEETDFSGKLHITDNVEIITYDDGSGDGAAIGSGQRGDFTGTVIIDGNANVTAKSNDRGAGIGAGEGGYIKYYDEASGSYYDGELKGDFRGHINIGGNSNVWAEGDDDSAGIGSGENGSFSGGDIIIKDNAMVWAEGSNEGPAIGAADDSPMNGTITIGGNAKVRLDRGNECNVDIGGEGDNAGYGSINILGYAVLVAVDDEGNPTNLVIGGEYDEGYVYINDITVNISSTATLNGYSGSAVLSGKAGDDVTVNAARVTSINTPSGTENNISYFVVVDENGDQVPFTLEVKDNVMTVSTDVTKAALKGNKQAILLLLGCGVDTIRFITNGFESELNIAALKDVGDPTSIVTLSHFDQVSLSVGDEAATDILK